MYVYMHAYLSEARRTTWDAGTCSKHQLDVEPSLGYPQMYSGNISKVCGHVVLQVGTQQLLFKDSLLE